MSERTLTDVVADLVRTGLTVEQQILVYEILILSGPKSGAQRTKEWRDRSHVTDVTRVTLSSQASQEPPPKKNIKPPREDITPTKANAFVPPKRGTRLPEDWHPPENLWTWGKTKLGLTDELLKFETGAFRDHFWSSARANAVKRNWGLAWRGWMREAMRRRGKGSGPPRGLSRTQEAAKELMEEIENRGPTNGTGRRRLCGPSGKHVGVEFPKSATRPENLSATAHNPVHRGSKGNSEDNG